MLEELQSIADSLSSRLRRSVAIDDPGFHLLVHTPHRAEAVDRHRVESIMQKAVGKIVIDWTLSHGIATATEPVLVPPNEKYGFVSRVCVPVRCQGVLFAYLWLMDAEGSVTDAEIDQAVESANAAGEVLYRERLLADRRRGRERELLRDAVAAESVRRERAIGLLGAGDLIPEGAEIAVLAVRVEQPTETVDVGVAVDVALQRVGRRLAPLGGIWDGRGRGGGLMLVAGRPPLRVDRLSMIAEDLHAETAGAAGAGGAGGSGHVVGGGCVRVGIGPVVASISLAHESHDRARDALRVAVRVPGMPAVVSWDSLGVYRLLVRLPPDQLDADVIPAGLRRLFDTDQSGVLTKTLEVYLDEAGRAAASIERLKVHRTSLYHRLGRIEEITAMSLSSGADRLALHLGIKAARLVPQGRTPDG